MYHPRKQYEDTDKKIEKKIDGETLMIGWRYQLPEVADLIICNLLCFGILQDESNFHNNCV